MNEWIEEIIADHVHQEMTRNWIFVYLRLVLLIVIKDVFLSLVSFLNLSKNLMDRTVHCKITEGGHQFGEFSSKWKRRSSITNIGPGIKKGKKSSLSTYGMKRKSDFEKT